VFSLTPAGTLRWTNPELYQRPIVTYREILFGPNGSTNQLYFAANNHFRSLTLAGSPVFELPGGGFGQVAVAPDASVHSTFSSFAPSGSLNWTFVSEYPYNVASPPDIGSDGIHYFVQNTIQLFALNTNGSQKWHLTLADYVAGPVVDPQNTQLLLGSATTLNFPGYIIAASAQDGHELWRLNLPAEAGFNQSTDTRARFTPDGSTAYLITYTATGDNNTSRSFVYALDTAATASQALLRSTKITLTTSVARNGIKATGKVTVQDANGVAVTGVTVAVTWNLPSGQTTSQTATTNTKGVASIKATDVSGSYTLTVTNLTKTGYVFDPANSVLTKTVISQ